MSVKMTNNKSILLWVGSGLLVLGGMVALADNDRYEREHDYGRYTERDRWAPVYLQDSGYSLYASECGDCHMAYPPLMLPATSWQDMMTQLSDHFGDNAELDEDTAQQIEKFLLSNSAGSDDGRYAMRMWRSTNGQVPQRITDTGYFRAQHHELPRRAVEGNPEVGSFSRCDACHANAEMGNFNEHQVRIPGFGRWDD